MKENFRKEKKKNIQISGTAIEYPGVIERRRRLRKTKKKQQNKKRKIIESVKVTTMIHGSVIPPPPLSSLLRMLFQKHRHVYRCCFFSAFGPLRTTYKQEPLLLLLLDSPWCQPSEKSEHTKLPCTHSDVLV